MDSNIEKIYNAILGGKLSDIQTLVHQALKDQTPPETLLNQGMISAMNEVGNRFESGKFFIPEMMIAGRTMKQGIEVLRPLLSDSGVEPVGKVVIGTVKADLHDIGKNLVGLMLEGAGFEVVDAGIDVSAQDFVDLVINEKPDIIGMSALLTTTVINAADVIKLLEENNIRDQVKVMFGGAPVTEEYAEEIGADAYAADAAGATHKARELCGISA